MKKKKKKKETGENFEPNDAWASKLLSIVCKTWTAYNKIILWSRFLNVNINLISKVQEI